MLYTFAFDSEFGNATEKKWLVMIEECYGQF